MAMAKGKQSAAGDSPDATEPAAPPMGYEEARAALAELFAALESGDVTLEEALALWEQGEEYARICQAWLAGAQERLSQEELSREELSREERSPEDPASPSD